jgi:uncharacterized DUF497 family protein
MGYIFEDAMLVFADPYALVAHNRMERRRTPLANTQFGRGNRANPVAHTFRNEQEDEIIRIISARRSVRKERKRYDKNRKEESFG